jgi:prepilin-type processing-associated H-X9-DG protein
VLIAEGEGYRYFTDGNDTGIDDGHVVGQPVSDLLTVLFDGNTAYAIARVRHSGGSDYGFTDGHVKYFKAPTPSYTSPGQGYADVSWLNVKPTISGGTIVYDHQQFPNAAGWFVETDPVIGG